MQSLAVSGYPFRSMSSVCFRQILLTDAEQGQVRFSQERLFSLLPDYDLNASLGDCCTAPKEKAAIEAASSFQRFTLSANKRHSRAGEIDCKDALYA